MKLAFSKPTTGDAEQRLLLEGFRPAGFEGLQLKASQYQRYLQQPERFRADWGEDRGIVSGLITGGALDESGVDALRTVIQFARDVGAERIIFCHGHSRSGVTAADIRDFAGILSAMGKEARDMGVRLSLHHHYDQPVMRREDFDVFFERVEEGTVGLTVDTAHLVKSGIEDIAEIISSFHQFVDNIHLKDFSGGEFRVLGHGQIDFAPVFTALREMAYTGWICADEESGADILEGMRESFEFLKCWTI